MRYGPTPVLTAGALAVALSTGCSLLPEPELPEDAATAEPVDLGALLAERFHGQHVSWQDCHTTPDIEEAVERGADEEWLAALECGSLRVPIDYADPDGESVGVHLYRQPASGAEEERVGSLLLNPGGPGVSGYDMLTYESFGDGIRDSFDLVSFDPRGIGDSAPVVCGDLDEDGEDPWEPVRGWDADPNDLTDAETGAMADAAREYAHECAQGAGALLPTMGTVNVARDLDIIRDALGDERLTYVGYSYGTHLGALYAEMFPDNTRAMVLDGAVPNDRTGAQMLLEQTESFQRTWESFVQDCADTLPGCPFDGTDGAEETMGHLLAELDEDPFRFDEPLWSEEEIVIDGTALLGITMRLLYHEQLWPALADGLYALDSGDPEMIRYMMVFLYEVSYGHPDEDPTEDEALNGATARTAVECADWEHAADPDEYLDLAVRDYEASPLFSGISPWALMLCAYWEQPEEALTGFSAPEAPPLVVVGTVGDPATPYRWSQDLAAQLDSATLLTYEGAGHGIYGYGLNECVDDALDSYLLEGLPPEDGYACQPE